MASLQLLALELSKAFVLYRQPRPAQAEFELLVRTWGDVLADVSDAEFREGCVGRRPSCGSSPFLPM